MNLISLLAIFFILIKNFDLTDAYKNVDNIVHLKEIYCYHFPKDLLHFPNKYKENIFYMPYFDKILGQIMSRNERQWKDILSQMENYQLVYLIKVFEQKELEQILSDFVDVDSQVIYDENLNKLERSKDIDMNKVDYMGCKEDTSINMIWCILVKFREDFNLLKQIIINAQIADNRIEEGMMSKKLNRILTKTPSVIKKTLSQANFSNVEVYEFKGYDKQENFFDSLYFFNFEKNKVCSQKVSQKSRKISRNINSIGVGFTTEEAYFAKSKIVTLAYAHITYPQENFFEQIAPLRKSLGKKKLRDKGISEHNNVYTIVQNRNACFMKSELRACRLFFLRSMIKPYDNRFAEELLFLARDHLSVLTSGKSPMIYLKPLSDFITIKDGKYSIISIEEFGGKYGYYIEFIESKITDAFIGGEIPKRNPKIRPGETFFFNDETPTKVENSQQRECKNSMLTVFVLMVLRTSQLIF